VTDLIDGFLTYAERDRNRSPHTLARYRAVLGQVFPDYGDPATIDREAIEAWWSTRYDLSPGTRSNELACLRSFFRWATKFDHRTDDPTRRLDPPKVPNNVPRAIGRADLGRLLGDLTADAPDLRRAVALGAYGGMRVSEAAGLEWASIDVEARRIFVRGKGQKERAVALSVVLDPVGTVRLRAGNLFSRTRKLSRLHQHALVFVKGDGKRAARRLTTLKTHDIT